MYLLLCAESMGGIRSSVGLRVYEGNKHRLLKSQGAVGASRCGTSALHQCSAEVKEIAHLRTGADNVKLGSILLTPLRSMTENVLLIQVACF